MKINYDNFIVLDMYVDVPLIKILKPKDNKINEEIIDILTDYISEKYIAIEIVNDSNYMEFIETFYSYIDYYNESSYHMRLSIIIEMMKYIVYHKEYLKFDKNIVEKINEYKGTDVKHLPKFHVLYDIITKG